VTIELHRGAFVNALTENIVRDHYQLYGMLYGFCVERALKRSGSAVADTLPALVDEFTRAVTPEEADRVAVRFADVVIEGAQSPRTRNILSAMSRLIPGSLFTIVPGALDVEGAGLRKVAKAVRAGDGARAAAAYSELMDKLGELCVAEFARRGLFEHSGMGAVSD
jgi:DNA-binding GntR family transcriptional regulator